MTTPQESVGQYGYNPTDNTGNAVGRTTLSDSQPQVSFPTLNPPAMKTLVYSPDVQIVIYHGGEVIDISKDIVRGQITRKENSASYLSVEIANPGLRYNKRFSRMDRVAVFLTRTQKLQVFSGFLDTVPYIQLYPGTVSLRATCTIKKLMHTWWNPALSESQELFNQMDATFGTDGDGQGQTDTGLGSLLRNLLTRVANWPDQHIHIQNFPQQFLVFLNNYFTTNNVLSTNQQLGERWKSLILGSNTSPGPMGAVGYQASAPVGATALPGTGQAFYLTQIVAACDQRGLGPQVAVGVNSQTVNQSGQDLEAAGNNTQNGQQLIAAGQQQQQYAQNQITQNNASDAAILAAACVAVSSQWRNLANQTVPGSTLYQNDGLGNNLDSVGLFAQRNTGTWGTVQQRMNAFSAAAMFFDRLTAVCPGWRNMDQGTAIYNTQQGGSVAAFQAAIPAATVLVQTFRAAKDGATNAAANALANVPVASSLATGVSNAGASVVNLAVGAATTSPNLVAAANTLTGRPNPDSEGAINAARAYLPTPWVWGGKTPGVALDCSGLVGAAFASIGQPIPGGTIAQLAGLPRVVPTSAAQRGDILQTNGGGHTGIYLGDGTWIQSGGPTGSPGSIQAINPASAYAAMRVCANGGPNPAAPFNPISTFVGGSGGGAGTGTVSVGTGGAGSQDEPIARNLFAYQFQPGQYAASAADFLGGEKAYIDAQPLIQMVQAVCAASLRNFASAPNGDFIAYYPDHFGLDGKQAVYEIQDIELKDCNIILSDDPLTTHVYVEGDYTMMGQADQVLGWIYSAGVATVENTALYARLITAAPGDIDAGLSAAALEARFGIRPLRQSYQMAGNPVLEFLIACQIFMGKWASQYSTQIGIVFMPELFPGMRIQLIGHNLQAYVSEVTHTFDWEQGFSTNATVSAASNQNVVNTIYTSVNNTVNPVAGRQGNNQQTNGTPPAEPYTPPAQTPALGLNQAGR